MREDRAGRVTMPEAREREDMGRIVAAMLCAPPSGSLAACIARRAPHVGADNGQRVVAQKHQPPAGAQHTPRFAQPFPRELTN